MSTNLNDALNDLIDRARNGGTQAMVQEVAEDWDLNPILLARKFVERTGCAVEAFSKVDKAALQLKQIEVARAKAVEYANQWYVGGSRADNPLHGKLMTHANGNQYIVVGYCNGALDLIRVDNFAKMVLRFPNRPAAARYISEKLL